MIRLFKQLANDASFSAAVTGFVVVLVGFSSSFAIVFSAAQHLHASNDVIASWMWALGLGMGISCIVLSIYFRKPIVTAWSTPGAALIAVSSGVSLEQATGAFLFSALLIVISGVTGVFARVMQRIPMALASAMLAGLLLRFGMNAFAAIELDPALVLSMFGLHLLGRRLWPRYSILGVLLLGIFWSFLDQRLALSAVSWKLATPIWVHPQFQLSSLIGLGIPLFLVTMASQNAPGIAAIRAAGFDTPQSPVPISPLISCTGLLNLLLAPFGAFGLNLAAITAAIAMSPESHPDPNRRYMSGVFTGIFYLLTGVFGAALGSLFAAFPKPMVAALAGLALIGTIGNSLYVAVEDAREREAALIAFLITASGLSIWGIGSAFWGLVGGVLASLVLRQR